MKITWQDVRDAEDALQRAIDDKVAGDRENLNAYFKERPHLLLPLGFDEYVAFLNRLHFGAKWLGLGEQAVGAHDKAITEHIDHTGTSMLRRPTGQWLALAHVESWGTTMPNMGWIDFHTKETYLAEVEAFTAGRYEDCEPALTVTFDELFRALYEVADKWLDDQHWIWTPRLWTPSVQEKTRVSLKKSVENVILELRKNTASLQNLTWQQYEELVAELLRGTGLDVYQVKETPQGGRDLLARGELIPGEEPVTFAVEVKHRPIVNRPDVQKALWQNRAFPALLFVTSGRFSAGVLREKRAPENRLRLFLKDGEAIGDLLRTHSFGR